MLGRLLAREHRRAGRRRRAGARFRRAGRGRIFAGIRRAVPHGPDSQSLRRPHVHRAGAIDPRFRREAEAQSRARAARGKRVVLVDDSIVRGTTSRKIVRMVREAGAAEVHMRISCPPTISPCYYGVDTPTREELIASDESRVRPRLTPEELEAFEARLDSRARRLDPTGRSARSRKFASIWARIRWAMSRSRVCGARWTIRADRSARRATRACIPWTARRASSKPARRSPKKRPP